MKKILKIILTIIFVPGLAFEIYEMTFGYSDVILMFVCGAVFSFLFHLFAWFAPKILADIFWAIVRHEPFSGDYDEKLANMGRVSLYMVILADVCLLISIVLSVLKNYFA